MAVEIPFGIPLQDMNIQNVQYNNKNVNKESDICMWKMYNNYKVYRNTEKKFSLNAQNAF